MREKEKWKNIHKKKETRQNQVEEQQADNDGNSVEMRKDKCGNEAKSGEKGGGEEEEACKVKKKKRRKSKGKKKQEK